MKYSIVASAVIGVASAILPIPLPGSNGGADPLPCSSIIGSLPSAIVPPGKVTVPSVVPPPVVPPPVVPPPQGSAPPAPAPPAGSAPPAPPSGGSPPSPPSAPAAPADDCPCRQKPASPTVVVQPVKNGTNYTTPTTYQPSQQSGNAAVQHGPAVAGVFGLAAILAFL